ncbi:hypothetical protein L6278_01670 [Candidatus Parcubacteria bacterium]|nr:hypothetical protein [Patescibacteria group bacterium]MCG2686830.1 hypothetical protein [Candidatus Parcubacteria bacterium]
MNNWTGYKPIPTSMQTENSNQIYYKIAYFFINNQVVFKRMIVFLLIFLNIILWWIAGVSMVNHLANTNVYNQDLTNLVNNTINWSTYHDQQKPLELKVLEVDKIKINSGKYDLVAKVKNLNTGWSCKSLKYAFVVDGFVTDWQEANILPQQDKYLFKFSYPSRVTPDQIDLKIKVNNWQRIKKIDQNRIFILKDFVVSDEKFNVENNLQQIKFIASNQSSFSFWQVGWQIVLYRSDRLVGANYVTTQNFMSNSTRQISVTWNESLATPSRIEIIPELDIFDENNYILGSDNPVNLIRGVQIKK